MAAGCRFSTFGEDLEHCENNDDDGHDGHDDDCGGDGDRKLDGSNGSSNACVGERGCTTGSPTSIAGRSL